MLFSCSSENGVMSMIMSPASQLMAATSPGTSEELIAGDDKDDGNLDRENVGDGK